MPRIKSFRDWMLRNFTKDELAEIARYGADAGWRGLTYTRDIAKLFDTYGDEIWDLVYEDARDFGARNNYRAPVWLKHSTLSRCF
jgi:hypothetical protein